MKKSFKVNKIILVLLLILLYHSCKIQKRIALESKKESCSVVDTLSNLYKRAPKMMRGGISSLVPTVKDADESILVYKELLERMGKNSLNIGRSPQVIYTVILLEEPFSEDDIIDISCHLKNILHEYDTKPILLRLIGQRQIMNEETGQVEFKRTPFKQLVIE